MRVCLVGPGSAGVLERDEGGGSEGQVARLALALSRHGHDVTVVDPFDPGVPRNYGPITILSGHSRMQGARGLRFLTRRLPGFLGAIRSSNADVYYVRGFSLYALPMVAAAKAAGAVALLAIASDMEVDMRRSFGFHARGLSIYDRLVLFLSRVVFAYLAFRLAHRVLVQHQNQRVHLEARGIDAAVLPNICEATRPALPSPYSLPRRSCIWIGNLSHWKGVDELRVLSGRIPEVPVVVVGPVTHPSYIAAATRLAGVPNVHYVGEMTHDETLGMLAQADILLNTSKVEGFPNGFLEAWSFGLPVVSLNVDPGGVLKGRGIGVMCDGSIDAMSVAVRNLLDNPELAAEMGRRGRAYTEATHDPGAVAAQFEEIVRRLRSDADGGR